MTALAFLLWGIVCAGLGAYLGMKYMAANRFVALVNEDGNGGYWLKFDDKTWKLMRSSDADMHVPG